VAESTGSGVTDLLQRWRAGDAAAEERLFELVQSELRRLARHYMQGERSGSALQPTMLLNETYMKLTRVRQLEWRDRGHFLMKEEYIRLATWDEAQKALPPANRLCEHRAFVPER
jgi:hypothetical protein